MQGGSNCSSIQWVQGRRSFDPLECFVSSIVFNAVITCWKLVTISYIYRVTLYIFAIIKKRINSFVCLTHTASSVINFSATPNPWTCVPSVISTLFDILGSTLQSKKWNRKYLHSKFLKSRKVRFQNKQITRDVWHAGRKLDYWDINAKDVNVRTATIIGCQRTINVRVTSSRWRRMR